MKLKLKILDISDVTQEYVDWYKVSDVTHYSDNQYRSFTFEGQKDYVNNCLRDNNIDLYGIFDKNHHIGNILIEGLNSIHKRAEISYVVGNTEYWGKGVGCFVISQIINISKNKYQLNKLFAGVAEANIGSRKILEKNGFTLEGKRLAHLFYNGEFHNQLDYGLFL
ncbi:GNAT family N-acetyltransferase [Candidatus Pelagibacter sp.]|nr:GNAT family N-acetyltransferase [Candidatus Pelagibacter sp.]